MGGRSVGIGQSGAIISVPLPGRARVGKGFPMWQERLGLSRF